jgi:hypothetical protein
VKHYPSNERLEMIALSNSYTPGSGSEASENGNSPLSRREMRANHTTGALPLLGPTTGIERGQAGSQEFENLIQSLRELFEHDRQIASQPDATRCGICYLYFSVDELHYREEGFYVCQGCERALGKQYLPMLRRQQMLE